MHDAENEQDRKFEGFIQKEIFNALASRDALRYFDACNAIGRKPVEDKELYDVGKLEAERNQNRPNLENIARNSVPSASAPEKTTKPRKRYVSDEWSKKFLDEAGHYYRTGFGDYADKKKQILMKYFPRFRAGGKQDLGKYDRTGVGSIFRHLCASYYARENKR